MTQVGPSQLVELLQGSSDRPTAGWLCQQITWRLLGAADDDPQVGLNGLGALQSPGQPTQGLLQPEFCMAQHLRLLGAAADGWGWPDMGWLSIGGQ